MSDKSNEVVIAATPRKRNWARMGIVFSTLAVIIFISAFSIGYYELAHVNIALAQQVDQLQQQTTSGQSSLTTLQQSVSSLQQSLDKAQAMSAKQEQLLTDWQAAQQGNLDKWQVAEAQNLVRLANDQLQFAVNVPAAITLLQRADQTLQRVNQADVLELRKSIAADIATLQALPAVDATQLYLQLSGLQPVMDQLPLPATPLDTDVKPVSSVEPADMPWWQVGLNRSWQALRQLVVVRYNGSNTLPLVLPEEKPFLYQNLHAALAQAMWGVLHRNNDVYQASLKQAETWVQHYFVQTASVTQSVLQGLQALEKINVQPPTANLSASLQLFDRYFQSPAPAATTST